ncbi:MAG: hypothetical protein QXU81_00010 [Candidatus Bathyarchaeia archaeon]
MDERTFEVFKEQLYEFVEFRSEPFDIDFLMKSCNTFIDKITIYNALCILEDEGRIIRLSNGNFISAKIMMRKWIKKMYENIEIPEDIYREMERLVYMGIYKSINDIIKDAINLIKNDRISMR